MTDPIIYEAQPIPPEGPKNARGRRRSAILGTGAVIVVLLVGVAFGATLFRGNDGPDPVAETDPSQPTVTLATPTTIGSPLADRSLRPQRSEGGFSGDAAASRLARPPDPGPPTPPLPQQEFTWEKVTLDLPEGDEAYLQGVHAVDDGFIAIGTLWRGERQEMMVWRSSDGLVWDRTRLDGDFTNANVWNVVFTGYGAIAFGEESVDWNGEDGAEILRVSPPRWIWTSPDGVTWTKTELDLKTAENQEVWINTGTAGPAGYLVIGQRSTSPEFEPIVIAKDGYQLEIDEQFSTYRVLDAAGVVVAEGSLEEIYSNTYDEDGQVIIHPDTGEILTVIPWETWERAWEEAYSESSGGPFGGYGSTPAVLTIEFEGYRITMDEENYTYRIEAADSGELISSGSADYLWRGPAPVIFDANGTEILRFTWEEFDAAQQAIWEDRENDGYAYQSEVVVAVSTDGVTWTEGIVETGSREVSFDSVIARPDGYLAYGSQWDENGGGAAIWTSPDGLDWTREADMPDMYIWNVKQAADGTLLAIGDGSHGAALWSSTDGITWGEAFGTRIPEDRNQSEWLNQFGTGEFGTVIVGSREQNYYDEEYNSSNPLTLAQGDYTLTFDDYDWPPRVTVVDNTTEDVVIDVRLLEEGSLPEGFYYEDGVTYIENNDIVLMAITDDEWAQAKDERWLELEESYVYQPAQSTMYFSTDLKEWTEVPIAFEGWITHVVVGADTVVLAGEEYYDQPRRLESEGAYEEDFPFNPPAPVIFVGRPIP